MQLWGLQVTSQEGWCFWMWGVLMWKSGSRLTNSLSSSRLLVPVQGWPPPMEGTGKHPTSMDVTQDSGTGPLESKERIGWHFPCEHQFGYHSLSGKFSDTFKTSLMELKQIGMGVRRPGLVLESASQHHLSDFGHILIFLSLSVLI